MSRNSGAAAAQSPPRGLRKRLIAFITVMLMALGFGGFSALPALASSADGNGGSEADSSAESLEEDDEDEDEAVEEDDDAAEESETAAEEDEAEAEEPVAVEPETFEEPAPQEDAAEEEPVEEDAAEEPAAPEVEAAEVETVAAPAEVPAVEEKAEVPPEEPAADEAEAPSEVDETDAAAENQAGDETTELALMTAVAAEDDDDGEAAEAAETFQDEGSVEVSLSDEVISAADAQRYGITITVAGLEVEDEVEILLNGETIATDLNVRWGTATYAYSGGLDAGEHTFTAVINGGESYDAAVTVTEGGYEPEAQISQTEVSERDVWYYGLYISGNGAEPGAEAQILLNGEAVAAVPVDEYEQFEYEHQGLLPVGEHVYTVVVSGESIDLPLTVTEGGYEPLVYLSLSVQDGEPVVSEWNVARDGFSVTGHDFEPGSTVTASVSGADLGTGSADEHGDVQFGDFALELPVGTHTVTLTSEKVTGSIDFHVLSDDDYYDLDAQEPDDLEAVTNLRVATETDLAAGELWTRSYNFPSSHALDLYINDELIASGISGTDQHVITDLEPARYTATWVFGEYSASVDFAVVPDEQGVPAPEGSYEGTAQIGEESAADLTFQIDENGVLTEFSSPRWFQCVGYQGIPTDPFEFDWDVPATPITVDQPFEIRWDSFVISGIVNSDGSASGEAEWRIPCWGAIHDHWTAQADVVIPDPEPTDEPEPTVEPTEGPTDDPTTDPDPTDEPDPTEEPTAEPTDPAPSEEPTQEPTEEPTSEPTSDPTSEPTEAPTTEPTDEPSTGGIEAPAEAAAGSDITITVGEDHAGQQVSVWLHSDPVHLGDPTVTDNGTVSVSLPATASGEHTLRVYTEDGDLIGTAPITITDTGDDEDDDSDEGGTGSGPGTDDEPGTGGSGDQAPASTDDDSDSDGDDDSSAVSSGDETKSGSTEDDGAGDGSTDAASSESASGDGSGDSEAADGGLAATGTTVALVAIGAGVLMLLGVGVLSLSRRRSHQTVR